MKGDKMEDTLKDKMNIDGKTPVQNQDERVP